MSKRNLEKQRLDRAAREILEAGRPSPDELEKIVSAPHLFASVQEKIRAEKQGRAAKSVSGGRSRLFVLNRQRLAFALAVLTVSVFGAFYLLQPKGHDLSGIVAPIVSLETANQVAFVGNPPENVEPEPDYDKVRNPFTFESPKPEKVVLKTEAPPKRKTPAKAKKTGRETNQKIDADGVFYALPYTAANTENEVLRIVRTELNSKSLFALGLNVAVENEAARVKTDLLVGADGVARAIRFVK